MILKNIKKGAIENLDVDHLNFKIIQDPLGINLINLHATDGLIIKSDETKVVRQILHQLRTKNDPDIYLMPVFLHSNKLFKSLGNEVDGYLKEDINPVSSKKIIAIKERTLGLKRNIDSVSDYVEKNLLKSLQYAFTRDQSFKPYRDRNSRIGYHFPFLSSISSKNEIHQYLTKLQELVGKSLLHSQLLDKINCCNTCMGSYLNFHETCSKCASLDLKYENLIHHFRCAYIGPESDFIQGESLQCPKCDKLLNHIGIDYDKPSEIANCNSCDHTSQETKMKASCIDCGEKNELSQLNTVSVFSYKINESGAEWIAIEPKDEHSKVEELSNLNIVSFPIFNLLVEQERARAKLRKIGTSFYGEVNISEEVYLHLNEAFRSQLKDEILHILRQYLRPIDILCAHHTGKYSFLLPDCKQSKAFDLYTLILDNLNKILVDNITEETQVITGDLKKL